MGMENEGNVKPVCFGRMMRPNAFPPLLNMEMPYYTHIID
jgi:hypothetical protein